MSGERLTEEEANELLQGQEDAQGYVNYEGEFRGIQEETASVFCLSVKFFKRLISDKLPVSPINSDVEKTINRRTLVVSPQQMN